MLYPTGFVTAIGYVGLAAALWTGIVPALMLRASRKKHGLGKGYSVCGGRFGFVFTVWVFAFGIINIAAQLLSRAGILPVFKG